MDIIHTVKDNILVITFTSDRLDAKHNMQMKQDILDLIDQMKNCQVVFDLQHLQFMDSSGMGPLLSTLRFLNAQGGKLKLSGMTPPLRTIFELVSMHKIFEIYKTNDEAISSYMQTKKR